VYPAKTNNAYSSGIVHLTDGAKRGQKRQCTAWRVPFFLRSTYNYKNCMPVLALWWTIYCNTFLLSDQRQSNAIGDAMNDVVMDQQKRNVFISYSFYIFLYTDCTRVTGWVRTSCSFGMPSLYYRVRGRELTVLAKYVGPYMTHQYWLEMLRHFRECQKAGQLYFCKTVSI